MDKPIKVVVFEPDNDPEIKTINNELSVLQETVGGYIQVVPLLDGFLLLCNENGIMMDLPIDKKYGIRGSFIISKAKGENLVSLTPEEAFYISDNALYLMQRVLRA